MKAVLLSAIIFVTLMTISVNCVVKKVKLRNTLNGQKDEKRSIKENITGVVVVNRSRAVVKLHRPKWNQHSKLPDVRNVYKTDHFSLPFSVPDGSNICQRKEEETRQGEGTFYKSHTCIISYKIGKCVSTISEGNVTRVVTTHFECCDGYEIDPLSNDCVMKKSDLDLKDLLLEEGRGEFVTAFDTFNLTSAYLTNDHHKHTIFVPTNQSLNLFKESLANPNIDNYVEITADVLEVAKHIRGRLVGHVVPELIKSLPPTGVLKLKTAHHDSVIFVSRNFFKNCGPMANCVPITSTSMANNGLIMFVDGFLQSPEYDLMQLLTEREDCSIFKSILEKLNLSLLNDQEAIYTFAIPNDAAFDKQPSLVNKISTMSHQCLKELTLNHIYKDFNCASKTSSLKSDDDDDEDEGHDNDGDDQYRFGDARIIEKDVIVKNGIVQFISQLFVPNSLLSAPELAKKVGASKFGEMLENLEFEPSHNEPFSIIIPTDKAIDQYQERAEGRGMTTSQLVDFHTIPSLTNLLNVTKARTAHEDKNLLIKAQWNNLMAQCQPLFVVDRFHKTCSYTIYFTNKVLEPSDSNIFELIESNKELTRFASFIKIANLQFNFTSDQNIYTVYALTDKEIENLPKDTKEKLSNNDNKQFITDFVMEHTVQGINCLDSKRNFGKFRGIPGYTNLMATNGVLHLTSVPPKRTSFTEMNFGSPFLGSLHFGGIFDPWKPFIRICWSNDDDELCEEFKKK